MVGACAESVRRWKRRMEQGGQAALRRRPASGRPSTLTDTHVEWVRQALEAGAQAHGFDTDLWTPGPASPGVRHTTGVELSHPSVWRLQTRLLDWSLPSARASRPRTR